MARVRLRRLKAGTRLLGIDRERPRSDMHLVLLEDGTRHNADGTRSVRAGILSVDNDGRLHSQEAVVNLGSRDWTVVA
jgi:hypothetical protein